MGFKDRTAPMHGTEARRDLSPPKRQDHVNDDIKTQR
jgi:hypothetical protein